MKLLLSLLLCLSIGPALKLKASYKDKKITATLIIPVSEQNRRAELGIACEGMLLQSRSFSLEQTKQVQFISSFNVYEACDYDVVAALVGQDEKLLASDQAVVLVR